jgi:hypothetical protein
MKPMNRTAVFLTDEQLADLQAVYRATGAKPSESIRRAVDLYLGQRTAEIKAGKQAKKNS